MKIALLTSHSSMNYGGLLQAYALKETIRACGAECEIVNYVPSTHNLNKRPLKYMVSRKGFVGKSALVARHYSDFKARRVLTNNFKTTYLLPKLDEIVGFNQLSNELAKYDIVCCGSDQLWNLNQEDNANGAYFLPFDYGGRSFTYAVSFGDSLETKLFEVESMLPYISRFDAISVREERGAAFLAEHGIESIVALDPTLLPETSFWKKVEKPADIGSRYILVYGFENAHQNYDDLVRVALDLSKQLHLPVVNMLMQPKLFGHGFVKRLATGPSEFLGLVHGAEIVCTNSYHGTIFSYLFNRPFVSVMGGGTLDSRKATLLNILGLQANTLRPGDQPDFDYLLAADFTAANVRHEAARIVSMNYLNNVLS